MSKFDNARRIYRQLADFWLDRHVHWPAFKQALRTVPSRFRSAETSQKRYLAALVIFIVLMQVAFVVL